MKWLFLALLLLAEPVYADSCTAPLPVDCSTLSQAACTTATSEYKALYTAYNQCAAQANQAALDASCPKVTGTGEGTYTWDDGACKLTCDSNSYANVNGGCSLKATTQTPSTQLTENPSPAPQPVVPAVAPTVVQTGAPNVVAPAVHVTTPKTTAAPKIINATPTGMATTSTATASPSIAVQEPKPPPHLSWWRTLLSWFGL